MGERRSEFKERKETFSLNSWRKRRRRRWKERERMWIGENDKLYH